MAICSGTERRSLDPSAAGITHADTAIANNTIDSMQPACATGSQGSEVYAERTNRVRAAASTQGIAVA